MFEQEQPATNWDQLEYMAAADVQMFTTSNEDDYIAAETRMLVRAALKSLAPRERTIIECRFGLNGSKETVLEDLAKVFGVTRERIRQIETKTLKKLRSAPHILAIENDNQGIHVSAKRSKCDRLWSKRVVEKTVARARAAGTAEPNVTELAKKTEAAENNAFLTRALIAARVEQDKAEARAKAEAWKAARAIDLNKAPTAATRQQAFVEQRTNSAWDFRAKVRAQILADVREYENKAYYAEIGAKAHENNAATYSDRANHAFDPGYWSLSTREASELRHEATREQTKAEQLRKIAATALDMAKAKKNELEIF